MNALRLWRASAIASPAQQPTAMQSDQRAIQHHLIFVLWLAFFGLMLFAAYLLWRLGIWHMLVAADPTFLTLVILVLFVIATLWCGRRSYVLSEQHQDLQAAKALLQHRPDEAQAFYANLMLDKQRSWVHGYFKDLIAKGPLHWRDNAQLTDLLAEKAHGSHETAWWVNGIQLKLGLLGKVIGFSILALHLGSMESFDASQSQALLKNLTGGLGIALLTTMTGLAGNILLGLQLTKLDRMADTLVAEALTLAETDLVSVFEPKH